MRLGYRYWIYLILFLLLIPTASAFVEGDINIIPAEEIKNTSVNLTVIDTSFGTLDQNIKYPESKDLVFDYN
jgi:hypothetical protein